MKIFDIKNFKHTLCFKKINQKLFTIYLNDKIIIKKSFITPMSLPRKSRLTRTKIQSTSVVFFVHPQLHCSFRTFSNWKCCNMLSIWVFLYRNESTLASLSVLESSLANSLLQKLDIMFSTKLRQWKVCWGRRRIENCKFLVRKFFHSLPLVFSVGMRIFRPLHFIGWLVWQCMKDGVKFYFVYTY
jgi:hypothetical protein